MSQLNILDNAISFITFDGLQIHFPSWISVTHVDDCCRIDLRNVFLHLTCFVQSTITFFPTFSKALIAYLWSVRLVIIKSWVQIPPSAWLFSFHFLFTSLPPNSVSFNRTLRKGRCTIFYIKKDAQLWSLGQSQLNQHRIRL